MIFPLGPCCFSICLLKFSTSPLSLPPQRHQRHLRYLSRYSPFLPSPSPSRPSRPLTPPNVLHTSCHPFQLIPVRIQRHRCIRVLYVYFPASCSPPRKKFDPAYSTQIVALRHNTRTSSPALSPPLPVTVHSPIQRPQYRRRQMKRMNSLTMTFNNPFANAQGPLAATMPFLPTYSGTRTTSQHPHRPQRLVGSTPNPPLLSVVLDGRVHPSSKTRMTSPPRAYLLENVPRSLSSLLPHNPPLPVVHPCRSKNTYPTMLPCSIEYQKPP